MSFLGSIFGGAKGAADPEGWQVGDLAECIVPRDRWRNGLGEPVPGPDFAQVFKVTEVISGFARGMPGIVLGLSFAAWPGESFIAHGFRKIRPRADEATPAEAEFTALVRRQPTPAKPPAPTRKPIPEFE